MVDAGLLFFAGTNIPTDEWGIDLLMTSSQKALALPPGLAFAAVSYSLVCWRKPSRQGARLVL